MDKFVNEYEKLFSATEGRPPINGRFVIGTVIIKHVLDLTDRETIAQIEENMFMQYFLGYASFSNEAPFNHSMLSKIRARLTQDFLSKINALLLGINFIEDAPLTQETPKGEDKNDTTPNDDSNESVTTSNTEDINPVGCI